MVLGLFAPAITVSAAGAVDSMTPSDQAKSWLYYNALKACVNNAGLTGSALANIMSTDGVNSWKWFNSGIVNPSIGFVVGSLGATVDGFPVDKVECGGSNIKWISDAFSLWGYSSGLDAWCAVTGGVARKDGALCTGSASTSGWDSYTAETAMKNNFENVIKNKVYGGANPLLSDPAKYVTAETAFFAGCLGTATPTIYTGTSTGNSTVYQNVPVVNPNDGTLAENTYAGILKSSDKIWYSIDSNIRNVQATCGSLVSDMSTYKDAYVKAIKNLILLNGAGDQSQGSQGSCTVNPNGPGCQQSTACNITGVGWILCPVLTAGASLADDSYKFLQDKFLSVNTALVNTDPNATDPTTGQKVGTGAYQAWGIMRNFANVAFVIVFLIIMFSQLTGVGISSYGVKKLLPRLIIGAVLVNVSFYICQLAVDLSNLLGFGLKSLMDGVANQVKTAGGGAAVITSDQSSNLGGITVLVIGAAALAWVNVGALIVAMVSAVIALLTIFIVLIVREVVIILLIVVSPLAFVAYLLPNTEPLFKRWRKTFTSMLTLFPIIGLIYGGGLLASAILLQVAGSDTPLKIAAYVALVVPLLAVIPLTKGALSAIPVLGNAIQKFGGRAGNTAGGFAKRRYDNSSLAAIKRVNSQNWARRRATGQGKVVGGMLSRVPGTRKVGRQMAASSLTMAEDQDTKDIQAAEKLLAHESTDPSQLQGKMEQAIKRGDHISARAAQNLLLKTALGRDKFHDYMAANENNVPDAIKERLRSNILASHPDMKGKDAAIALWAYDNKGPDGKGRALTSIQSDGATYGGLSDSDLAGQRVQNMEVASAAGHLSGVSAKRILRTQSLYAGLSTARDGKDGQREILERIAGQGTPAAGSGSVSGSSATPVASPQTTAPDTDGPTLVVHPPESQTPPQSSSESTTPSNTNQQNPPQFPLPPPSE